MTNKTEQTKTEHKEFTSTEEAFSFFVEKIYPSLSSEQINKIKSYVHLFLKGKGVSEKKLDKILSEYGNANIKKTIIL